MNDIYAATVKQEPVHTDGRRSAANDMASQMLFLQASSAVERIASALDGELSDAQSFRRLSPRMSEVVTVQKRTDETLRQLLG